MVSPTIVLASSSPYRRALLDRLGLDQLGLNVVIDKPDADETPLPSETPSKLVERLAVLKAQAVASRHPDALVIGSDQVASIDGLILGKPGTREATIAQLERLSGRELCFFTGLCLLNTRSGRSQSICEPFHVAFRQLGRADIEAYVEREQPYDCAGGFKSEGLGIVLFERLQGDDPNSLIGLPLIRLVSMLREEGVDLLAARGSAQ